MTACWTVRVCSMSVSPVFQSQIADNDGVLDGPGMFDVRISRVSVSDSGQ